MKWIGKYPPLYVWHGDTWYNEVDKNIYTAEFQKRIWKHGDKERLFQNKTKIMNTKSLDKQ